MVAFGATKILGTQRQVHELMNRVISETPYVEGMFNDPLSPFPISLGGPNRILLLKD